MSTMTTERRLAVDLYGQSAGLLIVRGNLTTFEFDEAYLERPGRPVLGQLFEEEPRGRWRQSQRVPAWFSNLLPEEGPMLDFLSKELGVSARSEARLLEALGSDLPGAVTVRSIEGNNRSERFRFELEGHDDVALPRNEGGIRFSVAGVHLKLSMVEEAKSLRLAGRGEWGNRYVKFPGSLTGIPENEFAMMSLARMCGLDVPNISLLPGASLAALPQGLEHLRSRNVFVIERFDRDEKQQIHIEDLNQVIGNWPQEKYQGMSYESLGRLVLELCGVEDFFEYVRRLVFNIAIGNEDAHLKNWSLIYRDRVNPRLAPAYDILSTVILPGFTRESALKLRGTRLPHTFEIEAITRLAAKAGADVERSRHVTEATLDGIRIAEPAIRSQDWISRAEWETLDQYRASVPLLRPLAIA
jgi:serine/threonine-protein kinase HipA